MLMLLLNSHSYGIYFVSLFACSANYQLLPVQLWSGEWRRNGEAGVCSLSESWSRISVVLSNCVLYSFSLFLCIYTDNETDDRLYKCILIEYLRLSYSWCCCNYQKIKFTVLFFVHKDVSHKKVIYLFLIFVASLTFCHTSKMLI